METKQPVWKFKGHCGDVDPIAHGGGFVYEDATGVYAPEMTWFEPAPDEDWHKTEGQTPVSIYRVCIERDSTKEWWYSKLGNVASCLGATVEEVQGWASGDTMSQAQLYFDSPLRNC